MKTSLQAVAAAAGVSASTVSRYLNGTLTLRQDTERRILDAVASTGYERQRRRHAPDQGQRRLIGLVLPEIGNEYFGALADKIIESAEQQGLDVIVTSTMNHSRTQVRYVERLSALGVEGILYVGNFTTNRALASAAVGGLPVVVVDEDQRGLQRIDEVLPDDYSGAYQAVSYLVNLGHRDIALATGPAELNSVKERRRGYRDVLLRAGIDPDAQIDISGSFNAEFGATALTQIISADRRPTAIFAASDIIAVGLMGAARSLSIRIPEELSVVGFDDIPMAGLVTPSLTTVHTPLDETARTSIALLARRMDDAGAGESRFEKTAVALVVRESTAAPPQL